jgi:hypothetical protein
MALFGNLGQPMMIPGYGGGMFDPQNGIGGMSAGLDQALAQNKTMGAAQAGKPKKGFGEFLRMFAGTLGDNLTGNPVYSQAQQHQREMQAQEEWYERKRQDELADYEARKGIDQEFAPPKDRQTITVDGIVLDQETMKPIWESPYSKIIPGPDGSFYEQTRQGLGGGQPFQPPQPSPTGSAIREQAMEAIRQGADPAAVLKRLQEMEGGQAGSGSPGGFL